MFDSHKFNQLINLSFFYKCEGNLAQAAVVEAEIDQMIEARNNINHQIANWLSA